MLAKHQPNIELYQVSRGDSFDGSGCAYGSKYRCVNVSVRCMQDSCSRITIGSDNFKIECHSAVPESLELDVCLSDGPVAVCLFAPVSRQV